MGGCMNQNQTPKISIIVPAYNVQDLLERCINSLIQQEYTDFEIVIIDDGSTDRTGSIADYYKQLDNRVIVLHQENKGLIEVRNTGIKVASGEFIGFVDGDDSVSADMFKRLIENAIKYKADISICGIRYLFETGEPIDHWGTGETSILNRDEALKELIIGQRIEPSLCNKVYRKELLVNSCIDNKIVNNEDLIRNFVVFNRAERVAFEDFCGYMYYRRRESMSNNLDKVKIAEDIIAAQEVLIKNCEKSTYNMCMQSYILHAISIINKLIWTESKDASSLCERCRDIIKENKDYLKGIAFVQRIEGYIILVSLQRYKKTYKLLKRFDKRRI